MGISPSPLPSRCAPSLPSASRGEPQPYLSLDGCIQPLRHAPSLSEPSVPYPSLISHLSPFQGASPAAQQCSFGEETSSPRASSIAGPSPVASERATEMEDSVHNQNFDSAGSTVTAEFSSGTDSSQQSISEAKLPVTMQRDVITAGGPMRRGADNRGVQQPSGNLIGEVPVSSRTAGVQAGSNGQDKIATTLDGASFPPSPPGLIPVPERQGSSAASLSCDTRPTIASTSSLSDPCWATTARMVRHERERSVMLRLDASERAARTLRAPSTTQPKTRRLAVRIVPRIVSSRGSSIRSSVGEKSVDRQLAHASCREA